MTAFLMIFRRFPTAFRRFPKIFQNCSEGQTNFPEHFREFRKISEDVRRLTKIAEDWRRLPKIFEEDAKMFRWYTKEFKYNLRDKLYHRNHRYLHMCGYRIVFYQFVTTRYTTDFYIINLHTDIHTYINFISIRIVNSTIVLVSPNTINKLRNQISCNNYI